MSKHTNEGAVQGPWWLHLLNTIGPKSIVLLLVVVAVLVSGVAAFAIHNGYEIPIFGWKKTQNVAESGGKGLATEYGISINRISNFDQKHGTYLIYGTSKKKPSEVVRAFVQSDPKAEFWPHEQLDFDPDGSWSAKLNVGIENLSGQHISVKQVGASGGDLIQYYELVGNLVSSIPNCEEIDICNTAAYHPLTNLPDDVIELARITFDKLRQTSQ